MKRQNPEKQSRMERNGVESLDNSWLLLCPVLLLYLYIQYDHGKLAIKFKEFWTTAGLTENAMINNINGSSSKVNL